MISCLRSLCQVLFGIGVGLFFVAQAGWAADPSADPPAMTQIEESPGGSDVAPNCRAELESLCKGIQPGGGRLKKCFEENQGKLSSPCQQQMQERAARMKRGVQEFKTACEADIKQLCPNIQRGGGRVLQCLEDHAKELSDSCSQALDKRPKRKDR